MDCLIAIASFRFIIKSTNLKSAIGLNKINLVIIVNGPLTALSLKLFLKLQL